jgi:GntR family transcriptional repressor for pyruvate dehydrogenase complex
MRRTDSQVDHAEREIRRLVTTHPLVPGDRLPPERELVQRLSASRPAVREAINRLVSDRVLESRRGSGTYVAGVDVAAITDVRMLLEPEAAARAARERTAAQAAALERTLAAMRGSADAPVRFASLDAEIHEQIAGACGNAVLRDVLGRLARSAALARSLTSAAESVRAGSLADMEAVVAAVVDRRPTAAASAMRRHLERLRTAAEAMNALSPPAAASRAPLRRPAR